MPTYIFRFLRFLKFVQYTGYATHGKIIYERLTISFAFLLNSQLKHAKGTKKLGGELDLKIRKSQLNVLLPRHPSEKGDSTL